MFVSALHFYPVKSLGGLAPPRLALDAMGPRLDRHFMLVDERGSFVTQRTLPSLCLISCQIEAEQLLLHAPSMPRLCVPLAPELQASRQVSVWKWNGLAEDKGDEAAAWLSHFAKRPLRLVRFPDEGVRRVDPLYANDEHHVAFADGYPVLLASAASLDDLNARLVQPVPMDRFRPNVVLAGALPFAEDTLHRIKLGSVVLRIVKPCERCVITTIDQATAAQGKEPLRTLTTYRTQNGKVMFGQNCVVEQPGVVSVGDAVTALD